MARLYKSIVDTVGRTPLVRINRIIQSKAEVYAKLEYFNPLSSVKDRIGRSMIEAGEASGKITRDTHIVEPTSGNTGIALAFVCAAKGYKLTLTMPDSMSLERRMMLKALGATLVLTPASEGMPGAINKAKEICASMPNSFMPQQFENAANPEIHRKTTAMEIWEDTDGKIDIFMAGVGTGGTITGVTEVLKSKKPAIKSIAIEPEESSMLTDTRAGRQPAPKPHKMQGIGVPFLPKILDINCYNEIVRVNSNDAMEWGRRAAKEEGILCGISSGAALCAANQVATRPDSAGKLIVVIIPSSGERYLTTAMFQDAT